MYATFGFRNLCVKFSVNKLEKCSQCHNQSTLDSAIQAFKILLTKKLPLRHNIIIAATGSDSISYTPFVPYIRHNFQSDQKSHVFPCSSDNSKRPIRSALGGSDEHANKHARGARRCNLSSIINTTINSIRDRDNKSILSLPIAHALHHIVH